MERNSAKSSAATHTEKLELTVTRIFDAPREVVWKEWAEPDRFQRWWGPKGFTSPVVTIDFREGGKYLWSMRSPEGRDFWNTGEYREIVPLERIVYTQNFADENGKVVPPSQYGIPGDWPPGATVSVTVKFEDHEHKTKMTLREVGIPGGWMHEMARTGWEESLDKLAEDLETQKETALTY